MIHEAPVAQQHSNLAMMNKTLRKAPVAQDDVREQDLRDHRGAGAIVSCSILV
jgi:hypothetical protein